MGDDALNARTAEFDKNWRVVAPRTRDYLNLVEQRGSGGPYRGVGIRGGAILRMLANMI